MRLAVIDRTENGGGGNVIELRKADLLETAGG
jgi:hypothetical protein